MFHCPAFRWCSRSFGRHRGRQPHRSGERFGCSGGRRCHCWGCSSVSQWYEFLDALPLFIVSHASVVAVPAPFRRAEIQGTQPTSCPWQSVRERERPGLPTAIHPIDSIDSSTDVARKWRSTRKLGGGRAGCGFHGCLHSSSLVAAARPWVAMLSLLEIGVMVLHADAMMFFGFEESWRFYIKGFAMLAFHACVLRLFIGLPGGCVEQKQN